MSRSVAAVDYCRTPSLVSVSTAGGPLLTCRYFALNDSAVCFLIVPRVDEKHADPGASSARSCTVTDVVVVSAGAIGTGRALPPALS